MDQANGWVAHLQSLRRVVTGAGSDGWVRQLPADRMESWPGVLAGPDEGALIERTCVWKRLVSWALGEAGPLRFAAEGIGAASNAYAGVESGVEAGGWRPETRPARESNRLMAPLERRRLPGDEDPVHSSGALRPNTRDDEEKYDAATDKSAQPLRDAGVSEDMASAAFDRSWPLPESARVPRASEPPAVPAVRAAEEDSDAAIMLRVRAGDDSGFTYLIEKYRRQIIHYMFRMTSNQAIAEELAQEVFLRVYRSRESYRAEAKFSTWLYRIATNLGVNHARDHKHEKAAQNVYLDQPDAETGTTPDVADSRLTVEQTLLRAERMAAIKAQVMALPERQRQAVLMHKYQEMDHRQIGAVLKLSESATKSLLFRAYQSLRERLKDYV